MPNEWKENYKLNIAEIDAQHRRFFEMLESTDPLIKKSELSEQDVYQIMRLLMEMRSYGLFHFYTEEKLMIKVGYPEFLSHMDLHDHYLAAISKHRLNFVCLFKMFKEGTDNRDEIFNFLREFVDFATDWFQNHISKEDAKYGYFIAHK